MKEKIVTIAVEGLTSLFVTQAVKDEQNEMAPSNTHIISRGEMQISWVVSVKKAGMYQIGICGNVYEGSLNAMILCNGKSTAVSMKKSEGYFFAQELNFSRYTAPEQIHLEAGNQVIQLTLANPHNLTFALSSVDTYPSEGLTLRNEEISQAETMRSKASSFTDGFGLMFHWTSQSCPMVGKRMEYEQAVNDFDTEKFAEMVLETNASYVIFTMNHAVAHFPAPLKKWEEFYPGMTTKRDLVEELSDALDKRNIKLLLYLNFTAAYMESPRSTLLRNEKGEVDFLDIDPEQKEDFTKIGVEILEEIGIRYGKKVSGYWVDSCYQLSQQFGSMNFQKWYNAAKIGNENRMVTFNYWILPVTTPWIDYWAGETATMVRVPDRRIPEHGPAKGIPFHDLIIMEDDWGNFKENSEMIPPAYNAVEIAEYVSQCNRIGAMVTINAEIYQDGTLGEKTLKVLKEAGALLKEEKYQCLGQS